MQYLANYYSDLITDDIILQSSIKMDGRFRLTMIPVCAAESATVRRCARGIFLLRLSRHRTCRRTGGIISETAADTKKCHPDRSGPDGIVRRR